MKQEKLKLIPPDVLQKELEYVNSSKNIFQRFWRSIRAGIRCERIAWRKHQELKAQAKRFGVPLKDFQEQIRLADKVAEEIIAEEQRIISMQVLLSKLEAADPENREEFGKLFYQACKILEDNEAIHSSTWAGLFGVSRPTIERWACGETAPHRLMRKPIMDMLAEIIAKESGQERKKDVNP